jgi:hypothetical protein
MVKLAQVLFFRSRSDSTFNCQQFTVNYCLKEISTFGLPFEEYDLATINPSSE